MKTKWPLFSVTFVLFLSILACNLPSKQEVNAAATVIALTFQAQTAQAPQAQPAQNTQAAPPPSLPTAVPAPTQIPPTPTPTGTYFVTTTGANCRSGPSQAYSILTAIPAGTYILLTGRNNDNSWWYVQVNASLSCWISNVVGYTTGNPAGAPIVAAPPPPTAVLPTLPPAAVDTTPPSISNVIALESTVYYYNNGCGTNQVDIGARISDPAGVSSAYVQYHYQSSGGTVYPAHVQNVTDQAMGGQYGFTFYTSSELAGSDGYIVYQVFAKDGPGNLGSSGEYHLPIKYCP